MNVTVDLEKLIEAQREETVLSDSGWLENRSAEELETIYAKFAAEFDEWLGRLNQKLGAPDLSDKTHPELCESLYCEARRLAGWRRGPGYLVLAYGQHDRETPVFVSFGYRRAE